MPTAFKLPELGENVEAGDVLSVLVAEGDAIEQDQPVLELETDKATIEVPSSIGGTVQKVHVKEGDKVKVGQVILTVDEAGKRKTPAAKKEGVGEVTAEAEREEAAPVSPPTEPPTEPARELTPGVAAPAAPSVRRLAREIGVDINSVSGSGPEPTLRPTLNALSLKAWPLGRAQSQRLFRTSVAGARWSGAP
jgi:pyruvate dehydrogenase E2 component (dihydrolipoamide acetyltransferase)